MEQEIASALVQLSQAVHFHEKRKKTECMWIFCFIFCSELYLKIHPPTIPIILLSWTRRGKKLRNRLQDTNATPTHVIFIVVNIRDVPWIVQKENQICLRWKPQIIMTIFYRTPCTKVSSENKWYICRKNNSSLYYKEKVVVYCQYIPISRICLFWSHHGRNQDSIQSFLSLEHSISAYL